MSAGSLRHLSISARLYRIGYEHRKAGEHPFARRVVHALSGRMIGLLSAYEAAVFCRQIEAGASEAEAITDIGAKALGSRPATIQEAA